MSETLLRVALVNAGLAALLAVPAALATCFLRRRPAVVYGLWLLVLLKAEAPAPTSVEEAVKQSPSCRACHDVPGNPKGVSRYSEEERPTKMHDEIIKLMNDLAKMKAAVKKTEDELRAKLQRFEKATGTKPATPPSADRRLDDMEKKLELLLKEMKDLRKSRGRSPDPNANPMAPPRPRN